MSNVEITFGLQGFADVLVGKADSRGTLISGTLEHRAYAKNVVTSTGLDDLGRGRGNGFGYFCAVGSGTGTPQQSDSALFNYVGVSSTGSYQAAVLSGSSPWYSEDRRRFEFPVGSAVGNLTELGLVTLQSGANIQSHALFTDVSGNPTTVTVLADDILVINYFVRCYVVESDSIFNGTVNSVATSFNVRSQLTEAFTVFRSNGDAFQMYSSIIYTDDSELNGIGVPTGGTALNQFNPRYAQAVDYILGSYYREVNYSYGLGDANGVWKNVMLRTQDSYRVKFGITPTFTKTASNTVNFGVRVAWANYVPA